MEYLNYDDLIEYGFASYELSDKETDIDNLFDDIENYEPTEMKNKIVLEYTDEEYKRVIDKLAELEGTKENII